MKIEQCPYETFPKGKWHKETITINFYEKKIECSQTQKITL